MASIAENAMLAFSEGSMSSEMRLAGHTDAHCRGGGGVGGGAGLGGVGAAAHVLTAFTASKHVLTVFTAS